MAHPPRRAPARVLTDDFPNPHGWPKRSTKARRPKRITDSVTAEALDLIEALAQCCAPLGACGADEAFLCVLPPQMMERLAALGAGLAEMEPSLGSPEALSPASQELWAGFAGLAADGEEDAGEMPEMDAGDEAEADPAESGIADADALALHDQDAADAMAWCNRPPAARHRSFAARQAVRGRLARLRPGAISLLPHWKEY